MKRTLFAVLALASIIVAAATAVADDEMKGGLGFRNLDAPIGGRLWLTKMLGLDAGIGFDSQKTADLFANGDDLTLTSFVVEGGLPLCLKSWDRVHFIARPGIEYRTSDDYFDDAITGDPVKFKVKTIVLLGELEAEVFLVDKVSISASHGIAWASRKADLTGAEADTEFLTIGSDFTSLGFHIYLWP